MSQQQFDHEITRELELKQDFYKQVAEIQRKLIVPKEQDNKFGGYKYRSCEDILKALKKIKGDLVVTISDDIVEVAGRIYVKATATITDGYHGLSNTAFAREPLAKKGMDESQITGAASSYCRKYALNGLLCTDDTKDADAGKPEDNCSNSGLIDEITNLANDIGANLSIGISHVSSGKAQSLDQLNIAQLQKILKDLKKKAKQNENS